MTTSIERPARDVLPLFLAQDGPATRDPYKINEIFRCCARRAQFDTLLNKGTSYLCGYASGELIKFVRRIPKRCAL